MGRRLRTYTRSALIALALLLLTGCLGESNAGPPEPLRDMNGEVRGSADAQGWDAEPPDALASVEQRDASPPVTVEEVRRNEWINPEYIFGLALDGFAEESRSELRRTREPASPAGVCEAIDGGEIDEGLGLAASRELVRNDGAAFVLLSVRSYDNDMTAAQIEASIGQIGACLPGSEWTLFERSIPGVGEEPVLGFQLTNSTSWAVFMSRDNVLAMVAVQMTNAEFDSAQGSADFDAIVLEAYESLLEAPTSIEILPNEA